jgi:excisionase family DNA binding protein
MSSDSMTVNEAAEWAGKHPQTIRDAIKAGALRAYQAGGVKNGRIRIEFADLDRWLNTPYHAQRTEPVVEPDWTSPRPEDAERIEMMRREGFPPDLCDPGDTIDNGPHMVPGVGLVHCDVRTDRAAEFVEFARTHPERYRHIATSAGVVG